MITILLVFAVYLQVLSESLPESSSTTPVMANFFIIVMGESACLLIATSFILHVHFKGMQKGCAPIPGWAKQLFLVYGARLVFVNGCGRKAGQSRRKSTICSFDRYFVPPGDQESDVGCSPRIDQRYQLEEFPNNQIERDTGYYHNNNNNNNNSSNNGVACHGNASMMLPSVEILMNFFLLLLLIIIIIIKDRLNDGN